MTTIKRPRNSRAYGPRYRDYTRHGIVVSVKELSPICWQCNTDQGTIVYYISLYANKKVPEEIRNKDCWYTESDFESVRPHSGIKEHQELVSIFNEQYEDD